MPLKVELWIAIFIEGGINNGGNIYMRCKEKKEFGFMYNESDKNNMENFKKYMNTAIIILLVC